MVPYERRRDILLLLERKEIVTLDEFSQLLPGVSISTVRRDLKALEQEGQVDLLSGGAAKRKGSYYGAVDTTYESRIHINVEAKEIIAKFAASMVRDGESIYIDSGSTPQMVIKYLTGRKVTLVTTNADIIPDLRTANLPCILVGGQVNISTSSVYGSYANRALEGFHFDRAFLGASGFDMLSGINTYDLDEAQKKQIARKQSTHCYVLADSTKEGVKTMCKIFDMGEVTIICEKETPTLKESGNYYVASRF